jgi:hypothetical protein
LTSVPGRPAHRVPWFNLAGGLEHWVGQNHAGDVTSYDMWQETDAREPGSNIRQDRLRPVTMIAVREGW